MQVKNPLHRLEQDKQEGELDQNSPALGTDF